MQETDVGMDIPSPASVEITLTVRVRFDQVNELSNDLKAVTEKYDLLDGKLEQSGIQFL